MSAWQDREPAEQAMAWQRILFFIGVLSAIVLARDYWKPDAEPDGVIWSRLAFSLSAVAPVFLLFYFGESPRRFWSSLLKGASFGVLALISYFIPRFEFWNVIAPWFETAAIAVGGVASAVWAYFWERRSIEYAIGSGIFIALVLVAYFVLPYFR
jgi:hypothetical protein